MPEILWVNGATASGSTVCHQVLRWTTGRRSFKAMCGPVYPKGETMTEADFADGEYTKCRRCIARAADE